MVSNKTVLAARLQGGTRDRGFYDVSGTPGCHHTLANQDLLKFASYITLHCTALH